MSSQFKKFSCLSEAVEHKACCGDFDECLRALHTGTRDPCSIARLRPSQTRLRSTIHVRPAILNARCRRLTICSFQPSWRNRWCASSALWCPASAMTVRMFGNNGLRPPSNRAAAFRSEMSAGSTLHAISSPKVCTKTWRLRPFTRLCASNPRNAAAFCGLYRLTVQ